MSGKTKGIKKKKQVLLDNGDEVVGISNINKLSGLVMLRTCCGKRMKRFQLYIQKSANPPPNPLSGKSCY